MPNNLSENDSSSDHRERGTGWVLAQGVLFALFVMALVSGDAIEDTPGLVFARIIGLLLAVGGSAISMWSVALHGSRLSPFPFPVEGAPIIRTGPYKYVRHPMYSGIVAFSLGAGLAYAKPVVMLSSVAFAVFFVAKSGHEEDMMVKYVDGYREYRSDVPWRIIPFVV